MAAKSAPQKSPAPGRSNGPKRRSKSPAWWRWTKRALVALTLVAIALFLGFSAIFYPHLRWAEEEVKSLDTLAQQMITEPTLIYSSDGKVLYRAQAEYRKPVKFSEIPEVVKEATIAAEDERFYAHRGVDYIGLARALLTNVTERRVSQGASTITMQLAKRLYTGTDQSLDRKLRDMALAIRIEQRKTKDEILKLYLNQVYYGAGAYGVSAAASVYFGKNLKDLTLAEAATLARIVQRPTENNPFRNPEAAIKKRNIVLALMLKNGMITESEYQEAVKEKMNLRQRQFASGERILASPYYTQYILDTIKRTHPELDITRGGFRIETTLDSRLQKAAEQAVRNVVRRYRRQGVTTGAFVLMNSRGEILAMVGGGDYERNQYNVIAQGKRQPGSAMKPFIYAAALSSGAMSQYDSISNAPYYIDTPEGTKRWPKGGGKGGSVSIRTALAASINVPAVRVMEKVGPERAVQYCQTVFGFKSKLDPVLALVLGSSAVSPLELAQGYSVFMLQGDRAKPFGIKRIVTKEGEVIDDFGPDIEESVLDPEVSEFMDDCLRAVVTGGTARKARSIENARGKTGTANDNRDAWFCGYTNTMLGIAWVASESFENGKPVYRAMSRSVMGGYVSVEIWTETMREAMRLYKDAPLPKKQRSTPLPTIDVTEPAEPIEDEAPGSPDEAPIEDPGTGTTTPPDDPPGGNSTGEETSGTGNEAATPAPIPPPRPSNSPPGPGNQENLATVEICADSGRRATPYCPETVTRQVPRNRVPGRCNLHGQLHR
jgi:penicillin-binding protein 1A